MDLGFIVACQFYCQHNKQQRGDCDNSGIQYTLLWFGLTKTRHQMFYQNIKLRGSRTPNHFGTFESPGYRCFSLYDRFRFGGTLLRGFVTGITNRIHLVLTHMLVGA